MMNRFVSLIAALVTVTACVLEVPAEDDAGTGNSSASGAGAGGNTNPTSGAGAGGGSASCSFASECAGDDVCVFPQGGNTGTCTLPWGRVWRFTAVSATWPGSDSNGEAWDALGGAPDPFVAFYSGDQFLGATTAIQDSFEPFWNQAVEMVINQGSPAITASMLDEDVSEHDGFFETSWTPAQALGTVKLLAGVYEGGIQGGTVTVFVDVL